MTHAVVTVEFDSKSRADLALPLNIPCQVLANAVAQALEVDKGRNKQYSLAVKTEQGVKRISSQSTLMDAEVMDGFVLLLLDEKEPASQKRPKSHARLEAESGQIFSLDSDTLLIGRKDIKRGFVVDIDLAPLDARKIVSRRHALLEQKKGDWTIIDQGSANGTWLNGEKLLEGEAYPLGNGDEIIFGKKGVIMKFRIE